MLREISSIDVNDLLFNRGGEVIEPVANCGGAHTLPGTLNVESEWDVARGSDKAVTAGQKKRRVLRAG